MTDPKEDKAIEDQLKEQFEEVIKEIDDAKNEAINTVNSNLETQ